jgi:hypothetical protein
MMQSNRNQNQFSRKKKNQQVTVVIQKNRLNSMDDALKLRPEYKGQPYATLSMNGNPTQLTTTVATGVIAINLAISSGLIPNFATRFVGFQEFRIVECKVTARNFNVTSQGIANMWYSEDDAAAPNANKALDERVKYYNFSGTDRDHSLSYIPHDPAQQTWTLVSSGAPVIGYFKLYSDNTTFGSSTSVNTVGIVTVKVKVQFRGLI